MITKNEEAFVTEYTRYLLTHKWVPEQLNGKNLVGEHDVPGFGPGSSRLQKLCVEKARAKKWVSTKENKVLSTGFKTAASFLKR